MTIANQLIQLSDIKQNIKTAINNKGGSVGNDFNAYANAITNLPSGVPNGTIIYGKADVVTIEPYNTTVKIIGDRDFQSWTHATGLVLGEGFETIREYAFYQWNNAESIILPSSLVSIGDSAFSGWSKCKSLILPNNLQDIAGVSFSGWAQLASKLIIPASMRTIGVSAFAGASMVPELEVKDGLAVIANTVFQNFSACKKVTLPASIISIGSNSLSGLINCLEFICLAASPPTLTASSLSSLNSTCVIKVPTASLAAYQAAANWSAHASKMIGI